MAGPYPPFKQDRNNYPYATISQPNKAAWSGVPTTSSVIGLSPNTTAVELTTLSANAGNGAILGRWGNASVTSSNFDFIVTAGVSKLFAVPVSVFGAPPASVAGANAANGLYSQIAVITATAQSASVFAIEY